MTSPFLSFAMILLLAGLRYNDTGLIPYTSYTYRIRVFNEFGFADSPRVTYRTPPGAPSGELILSVTNVLSTAAEFNWNALSDATGTIGMLVIYKLVNLLVSLITSHWFVLIWGRGSLESSEADLVTVASWTVDQAGKNQDINPD